MELRSLKANSIDINGRVLFYKTEYGLDPADNEYYVTSFWETTRIVTRKKYRLFGKQYQVEVPNTLFVIYEDTRDIKLSKEWWRSKITKELGKLTRNSEIEKGELI